MFTSSFSRLFTVCAALASASVTFASPLQRRGVVPTGPKFVVYTDLTVGPDVLPPLDQINGFNVVYVLSSIHYMLFKLHLTHVAPVSNSNLAFLLSDGPRDQAQNWAALEAAFESVAAWMTVDGASRTFVMGDSPSFSDFVIAGRLTWLKLALGENSQEWRRIERWHGGMWARLLEDLERVCDSNKAKM